MLFFLTIKKLANFFTSKKPVEHENPTIAQLKALETWTENDFLCKNFILNGLVDNRYAYYSTGNSAKRSLGSLTEKI